MLKPGRYAGLQSLNLICGRRVDWTFAAVAALYDLAVSTTVPTQVVSFGTAQLEDAMLRDILHNGTPTGQLAGQTIKGLVPQLPHGWNAGPGAPNDLTLRIPTGRLLNVGQRPAALPQRHWPTVDLDLNLLRDDVAVVL